MCGYGTNECPFEPPGTRRSRHAREGSVPSLLVRRVARLGIWLVVMSAAASGQTGSARDARVKQAAALAAKGGDENLSEAFRLYEQAARGGNADAMNRVGVCYREGRGVEKSTSKALDWFLEASKQGDVGSMESMGDFYANGEGVHQDWIKAVEWYERGAKAGSGGSMAKLGGCYASGHGEPQSWEKAVEWFEKAAALGSAEAMSQLGMCVCCGTGKGWPGTRARPSRCARRRPGWGMRRPWS